MAEKLAVRLRTLLSDLAPFGGITRIRFKGFVQDVSANSAPPLSPESKKKDGRSKREMFGKEELGNRTLGPIACLPFLILNS